MLAHGDGMHGDGSLLETNLTGSPEQSAELIRISRKDYALGISSVS
jgi:hypothetical protein